MTSDCAQALFPFDDKIKTRDYTKSNDRLNSVRVRRTAVASREPGNNHDSQDKPRYVDSVSASVPANQRITKLPPECFVCAENGKRHYLADCVKFKELTNHMKRQPVLDSGRCLNCLSLGHTANNCACPSKCRKCKSDFRNKHATALHDCYRSTTENLGAADKALPVSSETQGPAGSNSRVVYKMSSGENRVVLLRTIAVRVINPSNGKPTLAYAQLDTASQATLISEPLRAELGLEHTEDFNTVRTLAEDTVRCNGCTNFDLQSLKSGEKFTIKNALVVLKFVDDENTLPHRVDTSNLKHFTGVKIPTLPNRKNVDILIGQSDKSLLMVVEEREGLDADEPNYVLTRLGPVASGGRMNVCSDQLQSRRVEVEPCECDIHKFQELKQEIAGLKETLREIEFQNEVIQSSKNDEKARSLVEPHIKVVNERYEILVPLKQDIIDDLSNNYDYALKRTNALRVSALKNPMLKYTLTKTFQELLEEEWIVSVNELSTGQPTWYLPFFVTKQDKPRVVYDGAAKVGGTCLNQAVLAGPNLLNNLMEVLARFRLGKFACMADLSKCFFQIAMPEEQRDLFRIIWFKDNNIDGGDMQVYRFVRHVWGINSSPYIALLSIQHLLSENPTNACEKTLTVLEKNRYMDETMFCFLVILCPSL